MKAREELCKGAESAAVSRYASARDQRRRKPRTAAEPTAIITASSVTAMTVAITGWCMANHVRPTTREVFPKLSAQLLKGSGDVLATARVPAFVRCVVSARPTEDRSQSLRRRRRLPKRCHRDEGATDWTHDGVQGVPRRVDPRDLVRDKLHHVHRERSAIPGLLETNGTALAASPVEA